MTGVWTYSALLPDLKSGYRQTLGEGRTPLVRSQRIANLLGLQHLYFKLEITNPTGSYKDRFAALAISALKQNMGSFCIATSSGNTGSALAAYSASAGIPCYLFLVEGAPAGKIQQMNVYGAETITIRDFGKDYKVTKAVLEGLQKISEQNQVMLQVSAYSYNPIGMSGVETIAFEISESLPRHVQHVFSPAGGGGLTLSLAKGFKKWSAFHLGESIPKVHCVQPLGNDTIASALRTQKNRAIALARSETSISGLQVPAVLDGDMVIQECRSTGGTGYVVPDDTVHHWQQQLACMEGIYCEPAGAVALAGLKRALELKEIGNEEPVVCLVTGHGFKDLDSTNRWASTEVKHRFHNYTDIQDYLSTQMKFK